MRRRGWYGDSHRHYLAAKGIKTKSNVYLKAKSDAEKIDKLAEKYAREEVEEAAKEMGFWPDNAREAIEQRKEKYKKLIKEEVDEDFTEWKKMIDKKYDDAMNNQIKEWKKDKLVLLPTKRDKGEMGYVDRYEDGAFVLKVAKKKGDGYEPTSEEVRVRSE